VVPRGVLSREVYDRCTAPRGLEVEEAEMGGDRRTKAPAGRERRLVEVEQALEARSEELEAARGLVELEQSRYRELFELAPDAYLVTDASGRILEANRAAVTLLGLPHRALIGRLVSSLVTA
jgi:PAS domain-containing protein